VAHGRAGGAALDVYHVWWDPRLLSQIERAGRRRLSVFSAKNGWQRDGGEVLDTCIERHRRCV
jgi:hypothetical protein